MKPLAADESHVIESNRSVRCSCCVIALSVIGGVLAAGLGLSLARRGGPGEALPAVPPEDAE